MGWLHDRGGVWGSQLIALLFGSTAGATAVWPRGGNHPEGSSSVVLGDSDLHSSALVECYRNNLRMLPPGATSPPDHERNRRFFDDDASGGSDG
jgi:hypothetical protein